MLSRISPFWRGHLFLFDTPGGPKYDATTGSRPLLIFILMEGLVRPALLFGSKAPGVSGQPWWLLLYMVLLITITFALVKFLTPVRLSDLGLYPWKNWSATERLYFLQVIPIGIVVFSYFSFDKLEVLRTRPNLLEIGVTNFLPEMMWGFYQEFLYRGLLQAELVRRWGSGAGILVSNLIFTFGPLHFYHFLTAQGNPSHLWIFAAIFAIGLLFAFLFRRSGNLWIVGIMHGLGDLFLVGLTKI